MKILKKGCLPKERRHVATCDNCRTKFEFQEGEAKMVSDQRDGDYLEVKCPLCKDGICVDVRRSGYMER